jgi:hypothetical protein
VKWVASSVLVPELCRGSLPGFGGVGWIRYRCSILFRITKQLSAVLNVMRSLPRVRVRKAQQTLRRLKCVREGKNNLRI